MRCDTIQYKILYNIRVQYHIIFIYEYTDNRYMHVPYYIEHVLKRYNISESAIFHGVVKCKKKFVDFFSYCFFFFWVGWWREIRGSGHRNFG